MVLASQRHRTCTGQPVAPEGGALVWEGHSGLGGPNLAILEWAGSRAKNGLPHGRISPYLAGACGVPIHTHHGHHSGENPTAIAQFPGPNDLRTSPALNNRGARGVCFGALAQAGCVCLLVDAPLAALAAPSALAPPSYLTLIGHWEDVNFDTS